jgi:ubiquitin-like-conjugating enzyme ATG3
MPLSVCSYLVLFLKFIASVVPTIEYDYTLAAGGGSGSGNTA